MTTPNDGLTRRGILGTMGVVAGGIALVNHACGEDTPAAQVADTASKVRITGLKTHRVLTGREYGLGIEWHPYIQPLGVPR